MLRLLRLLGRRLLRILLRVLRLLLWILLRLLRRRLLRVLWLLRVLLRLLRILLRLLLWVALLRRVLRLLRILRLLRLLRLTVLAVHVRIVPAIRLTAVLASLSLTCAASGLAPAVPVADAIALVAPPSARVLTAGGIEHEIAFTGERRIVRLLPVELEHVAAQRSGEVADDFLALSLIDPDALDRARLHSTSGVVGFELHRTERRSPETERTSRLHLARRWRAVLCVGWLDRGAAAVRGC